MALPQCSMFCPCTRRFHILVGWVSTNIQVFQGWLALTWIWSPTWKWALYVLLLHKKVPYPGEVGEHQYPGVPGAAGAHLDMEPPHGEPPCTAEWNQLGGYPTIYSTLSLACTLGYQISSLSPSVLLPTIRSGTD